MDFIQAIRKSCDGTPAIADIVESCNRLNVKKPYMPVGFPKGTSINAVTDKPTVAEIQTALFAKLAWILRLAECTKPKGTTIEQAGEVTESLKTEVSGENVTITGIIKNYNDELLMMLKDHNINHQIQQVIFITESGHILGDKNGYEASFYSSDLHDLNGKMVVSVSYNIKVDLEKFVPIGDADLGYLLLRNNPNINVFTAVDVVGTSADLFETSSYNDVKLNYTTYPTVYFEVESLTEVRAYRTDAERSTGTTYLYKVNPEDTIGGTVISGNVPGLTVSGVLNIQNTDINVGDKFNVTISNY